MEELIESIKMATASDANDETRAAGAVACRTILSALEVKAGEPMAPAASESAPSTAAHVAGLVGALRQLPPEQLLDLAIARLRAALPTGVQVAPVEPVRFHIAQLPPIGVRK